MKRISKKRKEVLSKVDLGKAYSLVEACELVKAISTTKFDASVDIAVRLGVDPRKANQMVRGTVALPHELEKTCEFSYCVRQIKKRKLKLQVQITLG
jgi:large subunit ribosomal protein L1